MPTNAYVADVNRLFGQQTIYWIPQFQRQYAWNRLDQWQPLWEDILSIAERKMAESRNIRPHFMGAIVLQPQPIEAQNNPNKIMVIDGQQRLTTLQIIVRAIHQVLVQINCTETASTLQNLIRNASQYEGSNFLKVRQSIVDDRVAFQRVMTEQRGHVTPDNRIDEALSFFKKCMTSWLNEFEVSVRPDKALAIVETISEYLHVVTISIDVEEQPHIIFETLNSRGVPLLQSDLIRNIVMWEARVVDDSERAQVLWPYDAESWWRKVAHDGMLHIDQFLNCFLVIKRRAWPEILRTAATFRDYLNEVRDRVGDQAVWKVAEQYRDVHVRYRDIEEGKPAELDILRTLYPGRLLLPLILFIYLSVDRDDQLAMFHTLENYLVRRHLLGIEPIGPIVIIQLLRQCIDARDKSTVLVQTLSQPEYVWPDNHRMIRELPISQIKGRKEIRRKILIAIEKHFDNDADDDLKLHEIMPSKWRDSGNWPIPENRFGPDWGAVRDDATKTIGNFTLVEPWWNERRNRLSWMEKRGLLRQHLVVVLNNDELLDLQEDEWDVLQIRNRSEKIASIVNSVWPFGR